MSFFYDFSVKNGVAYYEENCVKHDICKGIPGKPYLTMDNINDKEI